MIRALALGAGALVALSLPPWGWWPLSFVGIAVFASALRADADAGRTSRWARWQLGALFGLGWLAPGMGWMWFLTAPGYVVAALAFASLHGLATMLVPSGAPGEAISRPAAHTLAEAIRFVMPFGGVPLASLAIAQASGPLLGIVRIGGALLLTWATFTIGFALGARVTRTRRPGRLGVVPTPFVALAAVVLVALVAPVMPRGSSTGEQITVAAVQGGGPQGTLAIETDPRDVVERHLEATRSITGDVPPIDMVVWPENVIAVPRGLTFTESVEFTEVVAEAERLGVPFLVGITERPEPGRFLNAQVVVTPEGALTDSYVKVRRVPFGEYMPLRGLLDALGAPVERVPTDAIAGTGPAHLDTELGRMAVVISWEVFFGGRARDGTSKGGLVLLNPTNGASYTGTILQSQQVASSRLRAVETGRWVVQVSPTGFSAFVTPSGRVLDRTAVSEQRVLVREIDLREGRTLYSRLGDAPIVALVLVALVLAEGWHRRWLGWFRTRRGAASATEPPAAP